MAEILRYEHVDIAYNGKIVVQDVSFTLEDGEILGIVGESGSGKSTVIKAAMGLLGPAGQVTRGDIYYKDYKMAGILIENTLQGDRIMDTVVGVGLDVNQEMFLSDAPNPVSLKNITGKDYDRDKLLADIIDRFIGYMELSEQQRHKVDKLYRERLYRREGYHKFRDANGCFEACIEGIQPNGCLMLQTIDGEHRVYEFKQVQFILPGK